MDSQNSLSMLLSGLQRLDVLPGPALAEALQRPEAQGDDPQPLGRWLFQQGYLTRYQLNQLATGRDDDLVVGPYILMEKIAEGGGGQVFKARHKVMNRIVALKRIRPELLDRPEHVQRFFQEAQLAAQLDHPNVVRAFDAGQVGHSCYLAMEFVDGIDLTRLVCDSGPLSVALACDFMRQAASGLQHAHERGLVHRDIKPSNLLVTPVFASPTGTAMAKPGAVIKLLDLGLARWQTEPTTGGGRGLGTPQFVAPEQAKSGDAADIRSDLYSIGCTFFYLLAGQPPFEGTRQEILHQHLHVAPPRVASLRPGVPVEVVDLIDKLLKKNPAERFASPKELVAALDKIKRNLGPENTTTVVQPIQPPPRRPTPIADSTEASSEFTEISEEPVTPRPRSTARRQSASSSKKSFVFALGIGLHLVAAAIVIGVLWWKYGRATDKPSDKGDGQPIAKVTPNPEKPKDVPPNKQPNPPIEKPKSPAPKVSGPFARGTPPDGMEPLDTVRINDDPIPRRTFPEKPPALQKLSSAPTGGVTSLAYVPGQPPRLLYADRQLRILDSDTGKQVGEFPGDSMGFMEMNPNGRSAAGLSSQRLQTLMLEPPGAPQKIAEGVTCFSHSANGNYLLAGHADNSVRLWNLISRHAVRSIEIGEPITAVTLASNGWLAIVGTERGQILFFDLESQTNLASAQRHQEAIRSLAVSPDGELVASVGDDRKILTWSTKDGRPRDFMPLDQPLHYVAFIAADWGIVGSRGGRMYCFHLPSRTAVSYGDANMGQLQTLAVAPNRRFVYAAFTEFGVGRLDYDPPPDRPVVVQPPPRPPVPTPPVVKDLLKEAKILAEQALPKPNQAQRIRFSPDGQSLAASGSDGTLLLFPASAVAPPTVIANAADSHQSAWWVANKLVSTIGFVNPKDKSIAKHVTPQPASAVNTTGTTTNDLVILGLENGSLYRVKPNLPLYNSFWPVFNQRITAVAMARDGKQAVIATRDKLYLCPLDRADPQPRELSSHNGRSRWLSYMPGDARALCVDDKTVLLIDVREGKVLRNVPLPAAGSIRAAGVSPDGSHIVLCLSDTIYAVAIETGEVVGRLPLETYAVVHGIDVSPDGRRLAAATEKKIIVWELPSTLNAGASP